MIEPIFQRNRERGRPVRDLKASEIRTLRLLNRMAWNADVALNNYLMMLSDDRVDQSHIGEVLGLHRNTIHMRIARRKKALAQPEEGVL